MDGEDEEHRENADAASPLLLSAQAAAAVADDVHASAAVAADAAVPAAELVRIRPRISTSVC
jgi:hypothetical protein